MKTIKRAKRVRTNERASGHKPYKCQRGAEKSRESANTIYEIWRETSVTNHEGYIAIDLMMRNGREDLPISSTEYRDRQAYRIKKMQERVVEYDLLDIERNERIDSKKMQERINEYDLLEYGE